MAAAFRHAAGTCAAADAGDENELAAHDDRPARAGLEDRGRQLVGADHPDTEIVMSTKNSQLAPPPAGTETFRSQRTAGKVRWGTIARLAG